MSNKARVLVGLTAIVSAVVFLMVHSVLVQYQIKILSSIQISLWRIESNLRPVLVFYVVFYFVIFIQVGFLCRIDQQDYMLDESRITIPPEGEDDESKQNENGACLVYVINLINGHLMGIFFAYFLEDFWKWNTSHAEEIVVILYPNFMHLIYRVILFEYLSEKKKNFKKSGAR